MISGGAVMGFSPQQVQVMTIQEFSIIAQGYSVAHGGKAQAERIGDDELSELRIEGF